MRVHDIGGLIWIGVVIFAVVSSIMRSAKRARASADANAQTAGRAQQTPAGTTAAPAVNTRLAPDSRLAGLIAQFEQQAQAAAQADVAQRTPPQSPVPQVKVQTNVRMQRVTVPRVSAAPRPPAPEPAAPRSYPDVSEPVRMRSRGFFPDRAALAHAVVAAEVLGKPLALRDEYPLY
jgi:hypothetical protein